MEEPQEVAVLLGIDEAGADEAGNAQEFRSNREPDEDQRHPHEGAGAGTGLSEGVNTSKPVNPKLHDSLLLSCWGR